MTAPETLEKIATKDVGTVQALLEALVQRVLTISHYQPDERDLRLCVTVIDYSLETAELYQVNDKAPTQRVEDSFDSSYNLALVNQGFARVLSTDGVEVLLHSTEGPGGLALGTSPMAQPGSSDLLTFCN